MNLTRFLDAQENIYSNVLLELKAYKKRSHWMWYIFPQIKGLGKSDIAIKYAIKDINEAKEFLKHPILGERLIECIEILLQKPHLNVYDVFGTPDDLKLKSSLTLFWIAEGEVIDSIFKKALDVLFKNKIDFLTIEILKNKEDKL